MDRVTSSDASSIYFSTARAYGENRAVTSLRVTNRVYRRGQGSDYERTDQSTLGGCSG